MTHARANPELIDTLTAYLSRWVPVEAAQVEAMLRYLRPCQVERNGFLFRIGDAAGEVVLLTSGLARTFIERGGREVNLRLLSAPAAALPYSSFLQNTLADEHVQAMTAATGYRVRFREFCREHPGMLAETMQRVLAERHFLAVQRRLHMLQAGTAAQRYAYFLKHMEPEIVAGTPAFHVASYLGITPESLSRIRSAFDRARTS